MMEPTKEQIQWLWEQRGLELHKASDGNLHWFDENHNIVSPVDGETGLPIIDLNNLFKYAVPNLLKVKAKFRVMYLLHDWLETLIIYGEDPALALFWAIYKALGGE